MSINSWPATRQYNQLKTVEFEEKLPKAYPKRKTTRKKDRGVCLIRSNSPHIIMRIKARVSIAKWSLIGRESADR